MASAVTPVPEDKPTFAGFPRCYDLNEIEADAAVIGVPYKSAYDVSLRHMLSKDEARTTVQDAPDAVRLASTMYAHGLDRYDFEFGGGLFAGRKVRVVDCGNVDLSTGTSEDHLQSVTSAIGAILEGGAIPLCIGGDHGTPIPILRAYRHTLPFCVVQVDAHIDFIDQRNGIREGFSSPMRRASEMEWVSSMMQVGLRGIGSAGQEEVEAALSRGSIFVRAEEVHKNGVDAVLAKLPKADGYYITIDADGLDPSIAPGVYYPSPGGIGYFEITNLLQGIADRGKIIGLDFDEIVPSLDVRSLTGINASRILLNVIGSLAHAGHIGEAVDE